MTKLEFDDNWRVYCKKNLVVVILSLLFAAINPFSVHAKNIMSPEDALKSGKGMVVIPEVIYKQGTSPDPKSGDYPMILSSKGPLIRLFGVKGTDFKYEFIFDYLVNCRCHFLIADPGKYMITQVIYDGEPGPEKFVMFTKFEIRKGEVSSFGALVVSDVNQKMPSADNITVGLNYKPDETIALIKNVFPEIKRYIAKPQKLIQLSEDKRLSVEKKWQKFHQ